VVSCEGYRQLLLLHQLSNRCRTKHHYGCRGFSVSDFQWNESEDAYTCPSDKPLRRHKRNFKKLRSDITKANTIIYRSSAADCKHCVTKHRCCPNTLHRKIARSIYEKPRDVARAINKSDEYINRTFHERQKVEILFAHMKRNLRFERLRLRGLKSANDEFLLVATAQNLRRMAKLLSQPPPGHGVSAPAIQKTA
jgi:hypothetical protein